MNNNISPTTKDNKSNYNNICGRIWYAFVLGFFISAN